MNRNGRILAPGQPSRQVFNHHPAPTFHPSNVVQSHPGLVEVDAHGGITILQWGALTIAAGNPEISPAEATRRAFETIDACGQFMVAKRAEIVEAQRNANGGNAGPSQIQT
jgi:hypothetical protein